MRTLPRRRPSVTRYGAPLVALLLAATLAGCSDDGPTPGRADGGSSSSPSSDSADADGPEVPVDDSDDFADQVYVAMGDSYTAAPGVEPADADSGACSRSDVNYPHLVQGAFGGSQLLDVSCSGATTADLTAPQTFRGETFPPQIDAVTADTDIVTVSTGGNDFGAFAILAGQCDPTAAEATADCPTLDLDAAAAGLAEITTNLAATIAEIQARAPEARVLVVGYPQVVPATTEGCDDLPVTGEQIGLARLLNQELANAQQRAAEAAGVEFVDTFPATEGHSLCSDDPWINGANFDGAAPYHPLESGQRAVAAAVVEVLQAG